jgi:C1A family cysteine protease
MPLNPPLDLDELHSTLQDEGEPWEMDQTTMTVLTEEERAVRLGVPLPPGVDPETIDSRSDQARVAVSEATAESVGAPASFDLRKVNGRNYTTPVKDQEACGSCVAFAVAATMEHVARFTLRAPALPLDLSEAHLYYCHGRKVGARCETGWYVDEAVAACRSAGITYEDYFRYTPWDQGCGGLNPDWANRHVKVTDHRDITDRAAAMKHHIATYGSVVACMFVFQDFYSYRSGIYRHVAGDFVSGHAVTLIGYSDAQRCWIAKNSWGRGWGERGYFNIGYGECWIEGFSTIAVRGVEQRLKGRFADVGNGHPHFPGIQWAAARGITTGMEHGTFQPGAAVSRGQMATFLTRALNLPSGGSVTFPDVPGGHAHREAIASIVAAGIASGFPDGTFRPGASVTRGQLATFLTRGLGLPAGGPVSFSDVPPEHTHAASIGSVVAAGIASGYPDGTFQPGASVTRGQMATFLMRALP